MPHYLQNKHIILGVTGSIAAYKSADLIRRLGEMGAEVRVVMTESAKKFITPLTLQAVSGYPVHDDLFDLEAEAAMGHIELARWADLVLIAPATAGFMSRLAHGNADDLLTTLCLATKAPIMLAPAMNQGMWQHVLTQDNVVKLQQNHIHILATGEGSQACGDIGPGRMLEPLDIRDQVNAFFATGALAGLKILITAGPTHEAIDPVRYLSNGSSGKMGYRMAEAAEEAGALVTLISGPVHLAKPKGVKCISVVSAAEMYAEVMSQVSEYDIFISVAAVSDYRAKTISAQKIHKTEENIQLILERNPDIIASVAKLDNKPFVVGFAAETEHVVANAEAKYKRKGLDMIIANQVSVGMGSDDNSVTVISADEKTHLALTSKHQLARQLIKIIATSYKHVAHLIKE